METVFLVLLVLLAAIGIYPLVLLLSEAFFYNAEVELKKARDWYDGIRAGIRHSADARAFERKQRAMADMNERELAARRKKFRDWLNRELGGRDRADAIDHDVLEAMQQISILRKLAQEVLPKTIERCCEAHRITAMAEGKQFIYEIALEPTCLTMRERTTFLSAEIVEGLERYPLEDPILWQNLLVIRSRIGPICRNCPYLRYHVFRAAREICPSAKLVKRAEDSDRNEQHPQNIE